MDFYLNIEPEELLKKEFHNDFEDPKENGPLRFEKEEGFFGNLLVLNDNDYYVFVFKEYSDGWCLNFKMISGGTNSDRFFKGSRALNILGQMIDQNIIKFNNLRKQ